MNDLWDRTRAFFSGTVLGVSTAQWAAFLAVTVAIFLVARLAVTFGRRRLQARIGLTPSHLDDYMLRLLERTSSLGLLAFAAFAATWFADLRNDAATGADSVERTVRLVALVGIFLQAGRWGTSLIDVALRQAFRFANFSQAAADTAFGVVKFFALSAVWATVAILVLSACGVAVAPLIAGLGVGGIAVGFALQKILGDIFCSVAIVLDRPFEVGDFIIAGGDMGVVEHIGVKTTRVRSLGGEQISFPNSDLVNSRVHNYKRMAERRVVFGFGLLYSTSADRLAQVPETVRSIINAIDATRFDRAHFASFGDSSLNFEVVYYVLSPDYNLYMDIQQKINLALVRHLDEQGIGFALPTRTLHVAADPSPLRAEVQLLDGGRTG